jgi:hypothetical protein
VAVSMKHLTKLLPSLLHTADASGDIAAHTAATNIEAFMVGK